MIIERIVKVSRKKNLNFHHKRTASVQWNSFHIPVENDKIKYPCLHSEMASRRTAFNEYATPLLISHIYYPYFTYVRNNELSFHLTNHSPLFMMKFSLFQMKNQTNLVMNSFVATQFIHFFLFRTGCMVQIV